MIMIIIIDFPAFLLSLLSCFPTLLVLCVWFCFPRCYRSPGRDENVLSAGKGVPKLIPSACACIITGP